MAKFGQFIHRVQENVTVTFDTSYGSAKKITINLNQIDDGANSSIVRKSAVYSGNIQLIRIKGTVSGSATQVTLKGYTDEGGNDLLLPPSVSTLEPSIDGTSHSVAFRVNAYHAAEASNLYLFLKTNTGSFQATEILVTWFE
tara:strand:+ start:92 stop:517 length:426 start_codon:yes stop_codon:yes gene_type:complete